ncbi:hypothetical protein D1AOALGA4SA_12869 [Olavius algarvensis Delta 1 endosymbiont]|nr:hypothetical protein D1AOALGA4SA_12869 [Olavius algarvensis Delta 1 endosymbiont]
MRFEKFYNIKKGSALGGSGNAMIATKGWLSPVLIETFIAKKYKLIPITLIQTLKLCVFNHYSMIPTFQHSM